jgi:hypothetical protein
MASATTKIAVSPTQEQILRGLVTAGGSTGFRPLFRAAFGIRWDNVSPADRNRYFSNLRALERKGLSTVTRRWGTWGYGQPELVTITDAGRAYVA